MLKNYLKLAIRSLIKQRAASIINITGLAIAVGCAIVSYYFISGEIFPEIFQENSNEIFQVQTEIDSPDARFFSSYTPVALGPAIQADHPQVLRMVRIQETSLSILHNNNTFRSLVRFADPDYLTHVYRSPEAR